MLVDKETVADDNIAPAGDFYMFRITVVKDHYKPISWMYDNGWTATTICGIEAVILSSGSFYCFGYTSRAALHIRFYVLFMKNNL